MPSLFFSTRDYNALFDITCMQLVLALQLLCQFLFLDFKDLTPQGQNHIAQSCIIYKNMLKFLIHHYTFLYTQ